jgi:hypothetical protein
MKAAIQEYVLRKPPTLLYPIGPLVARPLDIPQLISHWVSHQTVEAANRNDTTEAQPLANANGLPVDTVNSASARPRTSAFAQASNKGFELMVRQALYPDRRRVLVAAMPD